MAFLPSTQLLLVIHLITIYAQVLQTDYPDRLLYLPNKGQLIVGSKNNLIAVNPKTLERVTDVVVEPDVQRKTTCRNQGRTEEACANYQRVLLQRDNDTLLVCGTNAFKVECGVRFVSNLSLSGEEPPNDGPYQGLSTRIFFELCSGDPAAANVAMIWDAKFYGAIRFDSNTIPNTFLKVELDGKSLARTKPNSENLISSKDFQPIKLFEYGDSIFLVFREQATEATDSNLVYTRIARVCKNDVGVGPDPLYAYQWKTFVKITLKCSVKYGSTKYYDYNEIVSLSDVFDVDGRAHIVGVFRNIETGPPASAVCVYAMDDIIKTYNNPYLYKSTSQWVTKYNEPAINCDNIPRTPSLYVLISQPLRQQGSLPLILKSYTEPDTRLSHVAVVPSVKAPNGSDCFVLLVGTEDGYVERSWSCGLYAEVFYKEHILDSEMGVKGMMKVVHSGQREDVSVYISGTKQVRRLSAFTCHYDNMKTCVSDPLCAWSVSNGQCLMRPQDYTHANNASVKYPDLTVDPDYVPVHPSATLLIRTPTARRTATTPPAVSTASEQVPDCPTTHNLNILQLESKSSNGGSGLSVAVIVIIVVVVCVVSVAIGFAVAWKLKSASKSDSWSPRRKNQVQQKENETKNETQLDNKAPNGSDSPIKYKVSVPPSCETILETNGYAEPTPTGSHQSNGTSEDAVIRSLAARPASERTVSLQSTSSDKPLLPSPN